MYPHPKMSYNPNGVCIEIDEENELFHLSYNAGDDLEFEVSFHKREILNFLRRHKVRTLQQVDEFVIMDEVDYQKKNNKGA